MIVARGCSSRRPRPTVAEPDAGRLEHRLSLPAPGGSRQGATCLSEADAETEAHLDELNTQLARQLLAAAAEDVYELAY